VASLRYTGTITDRLGREGTAREDDRWWRTDSAIAFAIVAVVYLIYLPLSGFHVFYYDSLGYWELSKLFGSPGHFSLFDFHSDIRGYTWPLFLRGAYELLHAFGFGATGTVKVTNALIFAALGTLLLPRLARMMFSAAQITIPRILVLNALLFLCWRDYGNFPLTDFPGLAAYCLALLLVFSERWYWRLVAGLAAGFALNARPAYLFAVIGLAVYAAWRIWRTEPARRGHEASLAALVLAGVVLVAIPQSVINHRQGRGASIFSAEASSTGVMQRDLGMRAQKYETQVNPKNGQPQVWFIDPATVRVLLDEKRVVAPPSFSGYLGMVGRHPLTMAGAYLRRTFNGLDVQYVSPYVRDVHDDRSVLRMLILYCVLVAAGMLLIAGPLRRLMGRVNWVLLGLMALPCVTGVPSEVETRYFLPVTATLFVVTCFGPPLREIRRALEGWEWLAAGGFAAAVAICFVISHQTYSHQTFDDPSKLTGAPPSGSEELARLEAGKQ